MIFTFIIGQEMKLLIIVQLEPGVEGVNFIDAVADLLLILLNFVLQQTLNSKKAIFNHYEWNTTDYTALFLN